MHNFAKPTTPVVDSLKAIKKRLQSPKKDFFEKNETVLKSLYTDYDKAAAKDELHKLVPNWQIQATDDKKTITSIKAKQHLAYELYGSKRPFVNALWEAMKESNGDETLYCPICGLHECEEMDHFLPREEDMYPEYSVHLSNLIPLCHKCNHKKSTKFLDKKGNRIFFNAYYDILKQRDILACSIIKSPIDGMPQIITSVNSSLSATKKPDVYILSTIDDLKLLERFHDTARKIFKKELSRLYTRAGQDWNKIKNEYASISNPVTGDPDIVYPAVMKAISGSSVVERWFKGL